jgi:hypothetical protein
VPTLGWRPVRGSTHTTLFANVRLRGQTVSNSLAYSGTNIITFSGANALAYFVPLASCNRQNFFETLTTGVYSQHIILFVTYEWDQKARVFDTGRPFQQKFKLIWPIHKLGRKLSVNAVPVGDVIKLFSSSLTMKPNESVFVLL